MSWIILAFFTTNCQLLLLHFRVDKLRPSSQIIVNIKRAPVTRLWGNWFEREFLPIDNFKRQTMDGSNFPLFPCRTKDNRVPHFNIPGLAIRGWMIRSFDLGSTTKALLSLEWLNFMSWLCPFVAIVLHALVWSSQSALFGGKTKAAKLGFKSDTHHKKYSYNVSNVFSIL